MKRIAVTGAAGFLGAHLADYIDSHSGWHAERIVRSHFEANALPALLRGCQAVFHFAGISRSSDGEAMYAENMRLVGQLLEAVEANREPVTVFFASTTHEAKDTPYHASKRDGRRLVEDAARSSGWFHGVGVLIPNVFGPGGKPFYNSVTSTFCCQVARGETPMVNPGAGKTRLIHIDTLMEKLFAMAVSAEPSVSPVAIGDEFEVEVADLAARLLALKRGLPAADRLDRNLAATLETFPTEVEKWA